MRRRPSARSTATLILALAAAAGLASADASLPPAPPDNLKVPGLDGPKTGGGGRITVDKPIVDVGDVVRGKPGSAVFEIKNTGTDVLKILSAKPG